MIKFNKWKCETFLKISSSLSKAFFSSNQQKSENYVPRSKIKELLKNSENIFSKQIKASGPGGQHVNKTNSAVYMKELTTDISVKVSNSRDSEVNRGMAKKRLLDKIDLEVNGKESKIGQKIEKEKKKKKRNYKRSQEKHQNNKK
jgi:protein subunit release factor B